MVCRFGETCLTIVLTVVGVNVVYFFIPPPQILSNKPRASISLPSKEQLTAGNAEVGSSAGKTEIASPLAKKEVVLTLGSLGGTHLFDIVHKCVEDNSFALPYSGGLVSAEFQKPDDESQMSQEFLAAVSKGLGIQLVLADPKGYQRWSRPGPTQFYSGSLPYRKEGFDPVCDRMDVFSSASVWFRDLLKSESCVTQPRERALGFVLGTMLSQFRLARKIHESSPNPFGISKKLQEMFSDRYVSSQYSPTIGCGEQIPNTPYFSLDLEHQHCLPDEAYDLVVTQDVFEHIYDPGRAFAEIARTLKPGGLHVFTVPTPSKMHGTFLAAAKNASGFVKAFAPPEVHGNPMGGGALLTYQWGFDIIDIIKSASGMQTVVVYVESRVLGIHDAEYREVFISRKAGVNDAFPQIYEVLDSIIPSQHGFVQCVLVDT